MNFKISCIKEFIIEHIFEFIVVMLLLLGYMVNMRSIVVLSFLLCCALVLFSNYERSILYLVFFASFSYVFVYSGIHLFFLLVFIFIVKSFISNNFNMTIVFFYALIISYCILFSDFSKSITAANIVGFLFLFTIPLIANYADKMNCNKVIESHILSFVIATIIGYFIEDIPAMMKMFLFDELYTENAQGLIRFFGLTYDCNFYSLTNYTIVAYLLFAFKKINLSRGLTVIFLIVSGLQTFSKSYILISGMLLILYFLKNMSNFKNSVITGIILILGVMIFSFVSAKMEYNAMELTLERFDQSAGFANNTTGRTEIWDKYFSCIDEAGIKNFLFGFGFNASVVDIIGKASHNTYIEFLFFYGLVGVILWCAYFIYCCKLFMKNTVAFENKSPMVLFVLLIGIFFLSAYTYEAFWIGLILAFLTIGKRRVKLEVNKNV